MFRILIATSVMVLTGCSTIMCSGTGTCHKDASGNYITDPKYYVDNGYTDYRGSTYSSSTNYNRGAVITTNTASYVVVPNTSGGPYPSAIIRSGGK